MGMPTVGVYMLLAVLVAPSLVMVGVEPIAAHLFIFYMGMMSMITPPIAIGSFFAASIAKADPMKTALTSMRLGWTAYLVPFLFVATPGLLMIGSTIEVAFAVTTAITGVWCISVGFVGYCFDHLKLWQRVLMVISGLLFLLPVSVWSFWYDWIAYAIGLILMVLALGQIYHRSRRSKVA